MTDKELIRGIKEGEGSHACFRELYESYCLPLYKFVLSYVKSADTAKEITHEALVNSGSTGKHSMKTVLSRHTSSQPAKTP